MPTKQEARCNKMLQLGSDLISKVSAKNPWSQFSSHQQAEGWRDAVALNKIQSVQHQQKIQIRPGGFKPQNTHSKMDAIHKHGFSEEEGGKIPY